MTWKPIPLEAPATSPKKKTHIRHRFQKHALEVRNQRHPKTSYRVMQSVGIRLLDFVKNDGKQTLPELSNLVTDMQRTIFSLQKKRLNLLNKAKYKNRKKNRGPKFRVKKIQE